MPAIDAPPRPALLDRSPDPELHWHGAGAGMPRLAAAAGIAALLSVPWVLPPYPVIVFSSALVLSIACLGLNLLLGHTGLVSFGHAAYYGAGAYAGALVFSFYDLTSLEEYLLAGLLAATILAACIGFLCVRATRMHFTILTLAFAQMIYSLFISGAILRAGGGKGEGLFLFGGGGLYIPRFKMAGADVPLEHFHTALYYVILACFLACCGFMWLLLRSPFGVALRAIRDNDLRAECVGVRVRRYRWAAFVISGVITGLAGGLAGQLDRQVTPEQLYWLFSAKLVLATVVGGHRYLMGPVIGAFAFTALHEFALRFTQYLSVVLGVLLIGVVLAFPGGLAGCAILCLNRLRAALSPPPEALSRPSTPEA